MEQPSFIFSSENLELKNEGENFFVEGYISTSDLDLVNDIVTKACLLDMAEQMKRRTIKFDVEHESFRGKSNLDKEINKTIIPVAKVDDFLMDKKGLKVRSMLNKNSQRFNEVKGSIDEGFLDAFSIAYVPVKSVVQKKDGQQVRLLDKINLLNVAFTGNPVNTESKMTNVFAKSLEFLKDQEKAKKPKTPPKRKIPESEYEDDEEEGPGGHKPDKTGPHGRGAGPGEGRADGSGTKKKNNNHSSDKTKLQEVKNMSEEEKETIENPEESNEEVESKEEPKEEVQSSEEPEENEEVKALAKKVDALNKELVEIKSLLKKPMMKSKVEQQDKSENFIEEKTQNPLDLIA